MMGKKNFILINTKMFKICPYKAFSMFLPSHNLNVLFFLLGSRFRHLNLRARLFYIGYAYN